MHHHELTKQANGIAFLFSDFDFIIVIENGWRIFHKFCFEFLGDELGNVVCFCLNGQFIVLPNEVKIIIYIIGINFFNHCLEHIFVIKSHILMSLNDMMQNS